MPLLLSRIEGFTDWPAVGQEKLRELFPDGVKNEFARLYFEGAQAYGPRNFDAMRKLVPPAHILFGTDYNLFPIRHSVALLEKLPIAPTLRRAIERENALVLFPRFQQAR